MATAEVKENNIPRDFISNHLPNRRFNKFMGMDSCFETLVENIKMGKRGWYIVCSFCGWPQAIAWWMGYWVFLVVLIPVTPNNYESVYNCIYQYFKHLKLYNTDIKVGKNWEYVTDKLQYLVFWAWTCFEMQHISINHILCKVMVKSVWVNATFLRLTKK